MKIAYGGVWATIFICHLIFGEHLLNIPKKGGVCQNADFATLP